MNQSFTFKKLFLFLNILTGIHIAVNSQTLYINEILAVNIDNNLDTDYNEYSDWIEIYNAGSSDVDLGGYYLTDEKSNAEKWEIPSGITIEAGGYYIFWCDDENNDNHTNFELDRGGEFIALYNPSEELVDSVTYNRQHNDTSFGRLAGDINSWVYFANPSAGTVNSGTYFTGMVEKVLFSISGGLYTGSQILTLSCSTPSSEIRYTLNGEKPDETSTLYTADITLDETTVVRALAFAASMLPNDIVTYTYFINEEMNLPFISLSTDPDNFFDDEIGIYVKGTNGTTGYCGSTPLNINRDWERPLNIEFYDTNGVLAFNQQAGTKIFGGCSRERYPQKSLAMYARKEYGKKRFEYQLFHDKSVNEFKTFLLRSSADDAPFCMYRDGLAQSVLIGEMNIDYQAYRPVVVFLNGEYWGIHNMREKINEHYPEGNYNLDSEEINVIKRNPADMFNALAGNADHYNAMLDFMESNEMSDNDNYEYVQTQMDVDNYIDYMIAEIYLSADDWPGNNIKYWRANSGKYDRWRWIFYDMDWTFTHIERDILDRATEPNGYMWYNPPWSTLLFRLLLENQSFRDEFVQRYAYYMNTTFEPERLKYFIDSLQANIAPEIPRHIDKWGGQTVEDAESWISPTFNSVAEWEANVEEMRVFCDERPAHAIDHLENYFGISDMAQLTVRSDDTDKGIIKIHDELQPEGEFQGDFFVNVPVRVKAVSSLGYRFLRWEAASASGTDIYTTPELNFELLQDVTLTAFFEDDIMTGAPVIINEINYHSPDDVNPGDWLELYNRRDEPVDLTGWVFKDEEDDHIFEFPNGLEIAAEDYLVICEDFEDFESVFSNVNNLIGETDFGLSNSGEVLRLYDDEGTLIDSVLYDDHLPWPESPDGDGPTLSLRNVDLDNDLAENWGPSYENGSPGAENQINDMIAVPETFAKEEKNILYQNYPNPSDEYTYIAYKLSDNALVQVALKDIFGREVLYIINEYQKADTYTLLLETSELTEGIYFYSLAIDGHITDTKRLVVVR